MLPSPIAQVDQLVPSMLSFVIEEIKKAVRIDGEIQISRGITYDSTSHKRQIGAVDDKLYKQAQRRYFHKKYYSLDPEKFRRKGRESYARHREERLKQHHEYYDKYREELLSNKRAYYLANREQILADRKAKYVPYPKEVIDTPQAELKRQRERERYQSKKDEINARRRANRKKARETNADIEEQQAVSV